MNKILKNTEAKLVILGSLVVLLILGFMIYTDIFVQTVITKEVKVTTKAFEPTNTQEITTPNLGQIDTSSIPKAKYRLLNGWNFIAFPIKPLNFSNASGLMLDIKHKGGYATVVARWDGDRWQEYVQRGDEIFGDNFAINPGEGYFVRNHVTMDWEIVGAEVKPSEISNYSLQKGWNAVGLISNNQKAEDVLDSINQGQEIANEIDWWDSGSWTIYVKRHYSDANIRSYGTNFVIENNKGYMIKLEKDREWTNQ